MTNLYFVRHAEPVHSWRDNRTRPLSPEGEIDRGQVTDFFRDIHIDAFLSSPYKRSADTIAPCAGWHNMEITFDERLRERKAGENGNRNFEYMRMRWADFDFCEPGGETLRSVQTRNVEALREILNAYNGKSVVIGTHGTAQSTILNFCNPNFCIDDFLRIIDFMPYIIRLDFNGQEYVGLEELLVINKEFKSNYL